MLFRSLESEDYLIRNFSNIKLKNYSRKSSSKSKYKKLKRNPYAICTESIYNKRGLQRNFSLRGDFKKSCLF